MSRTRNVGTPQPLGLWIIITRSVFLLHLRTGTWLELLIWIDHIISARVGRVPTLRWVAPVERSWRLLLVEIDGWLPGPVMIARSQLTRLDSGRMVVGLCLALDRNSLDSCVAFNSWSSVPGSQATNLPPMGLNSRVICLLG